MAKKRSDAMRRQVAKVTTVNLEAQAHSAKAEDVLIKLEDRDARRRERTDRAIANLPAADRRS